MVLLVLLIVITLIIQIIHRLTQIKIFVIPALELANDQNHQAALSH